MLDRSCLIKTRIKRQLLFTFIILLCVVFLIFSSFYLSPSGVLRCIYAKHLLLSFFQKYLTAFIHYFLSQKGFIIDVWQSPKYTCHDFVTSYLVMVEQLCMQQFINWFYATGFFPYPLKTSESLSLPPENIRKPFWNSFLIFSGGRERFSDVFRGYRKRPVA